MARYRYSRWDGSQEVEGLDEDRILESLSDELLTHGDLERALRNMLYRGLRSEDQRILGLRDLIERIRQQRQQRLERHDLDSLLDDLEQRLRDVIDTERAGIERRVDEANEQLSKAGQDEGELGSAMDVLQKRAQRARETLDSLPESPAGAIMVLKEYDFIDPDAQRKFQELLDMLSESMMNSVVNNMRGQLEQMTPEQRERLNEMLHALNQMLRDRAAGLEPDFDSFKAPTRQILMITDGEPTAHLEGEYAYFNYPPSYYTVVETLREVRRCTRAGITINTFMLASTPYLMNFVDKMTEINRGRAFFSTPTQLGKYVMVDYLNGRRKRVG